MWQLSLSFFFITQAKFYRCPTPHTSTYWSAMYYEASSGYKMSREEGCSWGKSSRVWVKEREYKKGWGSSENGLRRNWGKRPVTIIGEIVGGDERWRVNDPDAFGHLCHRTSDLPLWGGLYKMDLPYLFFIHSTHVKSLVHIPRMFLKEHIIWLYGL